MNSRKGGSLNRADMSRGAGYTVAIRAFAYCALIGGAVFIFGLVCAVLKSIPVGAALGIGYAGLLLTIVSLREVRRGIRLRSKARAGGVEDNAGPTSTRDMARRWRVAAVGNTVAGLVLSALALAFLPVSWGIVVTLVLAAGIFITWHFEWRISGRGARQ